MGQMWRWLSTADAVVATDLQLGFAKDLTTDFGHPYLAKHCDANPAA
jgi:hypothetical protein